MEPVIYEKKNYTQLLITLVLVVGLVALIGGYIYYGMQQAIVSEQPVVEETQTPETPNAATPVVITDAERQAILNDLAKTASTSKPLTPTERQALLDSLSTNETSGTGTLLTDEERTKIISDLEKPTTVTIPENNYPTYTDIAPNP